MRVDIVTIIFVCGIVGVCLLGAHLLFDKGYAEKIKDIPSELRKIIPKSEHRNQTELPAAFQNLSPEYKERVKNLYL